MFADVNFVIEKCTQNCVFLLPTSKLSAMFILPYAVSVLCFKKNLNTVVD